MTKTAAGGKAAGRCPICKGPRDPDVGKSAYHPFCSKRCADIDLGRWFNGDYTIPAVEPPDEWELDFEDR